MSRWLPPAAGLLACLALAPAARAGDAGEVRAEAVKALNRGVTAYRKGLYGEASGNLEHAASLALNNFRAYYYLGLARIGDRRYPEALEALAVALDLDPNHLQAHVAKGDALLKLGNVDEARAAYFLALKLRPEFAPALDGLARVEQARDDFEKAIELFRRAIAGDAGFAPAYAHLGDAYLERQEFEQAVDLLEEAVSVRPDFAAGMNRLARAYGELGLETLAIGTIRNATEIEPNNPAHRATLGWLQIREGLVSTAEGSFLAALELDPAFPDARRGLAEVARRRGQYDLALSQLDGALADERLDAAERRRLGEDRERLQAEYARLRDLEELRDRGDANPDDHAQLGLIYAARGEWERAVDELEAAQGSERRDERLAYALFRAGRFREALSYYEQAGDADAATAINRGVCAAQLGHDEKAAEAFRRALELDPANRTALLYLGNALLRLGRREEAVDVYVAFLEGDRRGNAAERVRRILLQIAPQRVAAREEPSS